MIGFLQGIIFKKSSNYILVNVKGVGYKLFLGPQTLTSLKLEITQDFFVHTHVRDDDISLFGFLTNDELELFELLLTVSGIGPKTGLLVVDKGVDKITQAISQANVEFFTGIPRLGRKNSQKIIIELKNKLGSVKELDLQDYSQEFGQAVQALVSMGYAKNQAIEVLKKAPVEIKNLEDYLRFGLKNLVKKNYGK